MMTRLDELLAEQRRRAAAPEAAHDAPVDAPEAEDVETPPDEPSASDTPAWLIEAVGILKATGRWPAWLTDRHPNFLEAAKNEAYARGLLQRPLMLW